MSKRIEIMRWAAEDKIYRKDEWVRQDNEAILSLEQKLDKLDLSEEERAVVDEYIACRESKEDRMGYLLYKAGMKDTKRRIRIRKFISKLLLITTIGGGALLWYKKNQDRVKDIKSIFDSFCQKK